MSTSTSAPNLSSSPSPSPPLEPSPKSASTSSSVSNANVISTSISSTGPTTVRNNSTSTNSGGYHHNHNHQQHHNYSNNNSNGYNNRYNNGYKVNYYHHHNHNNGVNYHQNNRRYNNYQHNQSSSGYNNYNNHSQYYNNSSNQFYNSSNNPQHSFNHLSPPSTSVVTSSTVLSQTAVQQPNATSPVLPLKFSGYYWPPGTCNSTNDDSSENDGGCSSEVSGPSSLESQGSSISFFSFPSKRGQNGYVSDGKRSIPQETLTFIKADSPIYWPSHLFSPKIYTTFPFEREHDRRLRPKGYCDGFENLSLERIDPDELVKAFKFGEVLEKPANLAPEGSLWANLSEEIWEMFQTNQQTMETFRKKMELWRDMSETLRLMKNFRHFGLQVVGSTMSGFGSNTSDVDMCLLVRRFEIDQQGEAVDLLHQFWAALGPHPNIDRIDMVYAKVPLLKCHDSERNLEVDLNCNNYVGIRNTHLLYCYAQQDWRLKPLVLIIKLWAKFHDINDAKSMTISSYSLVLMVIHFLQCGVTPPVLPCLHKLYPHKFMYHPDIIKVKRYINETLPIEPSQNTQTIGELLVKFFEYYSIKFDFKLYAISVRLGTAIPVKYCQTNKAAKNDPQQWKHLCIEEPFDCTNAARSVYDRETFDRIRGIFFSSWQRIYLDRNLDTIFDYLPPFEARQIGIRLRT